MESFVLWSLAIVMMFTGAHCISQAQSCTTVNGVTTCTSERSNGNTAGARSGVVTNDQGYYQETAAGTGNTNTGSSSSSQSSSGNLPPGFFPDPFQPQQGGQDGVFNPFDFVGVPDPMRMFGGFPFGRR